MTDINMVYGHANGTRAILSECENVRITQSPTPIPDMDLYVYQGGASWCGTTSRTTGGMKVLLQGEPVVVQPGDYTKALWDQFDAVLTYHNRMAGASDKFIKMEHSAMGVGFPPDTRSYDCPAPPGDRELNICMMLGNKFSDIPGEIYSLRREMGEWFWRWGDINFEAYGMPEYPTEMCGLGYVQPKDKFNMLNKFPFTVAFENVYDDLWSDGFFTERVIECLYCSTIPIYLGDTKIADRLPPELYVDFRKFEHNGAFDEVSFQMLEEYLEEEFYSEGAMYRRYDAIEEWWEEDNIFKYRQSSNYALWSSLVGIDIDPTFIWTECDPEGKPMPHYGMNVNQRWQIMSQIPFLTAEHDVKELIDV